MENLEIDGMTRTLLHTSLPSLLQSGYSRPVLWSDDHQEVPEGGVGGEHGSLLTDLAPVPPRGGLAEVGEEDRLVVTESSLQEES